MENTILSLQNKLKIHKAIIYVLSGFLLAMVFFIIFDNKTSQNASKGANIKSIDTVVVRDTLRIEVPVEKIKYRDRKIVDTLYLQTPQDTTPLPIEEKVYEDSISTIQISGYKPQIDKIEYHIPQKTVYVDKVVEVPQVKKWYEDRFIFSAGVYTGYSPIYNNFDVIVGFGVGVRLGK
jgi:hypothetical protein